MYSTCCFTVDLRVRDFHTWPSAISNQSVVTIMDVAHGGDILKKMLEGVRCVYGRIIGPRGGRFPPVGRSAFTNIFVTASSC